MIYLTRIKKICAFSKQSCQYCYNTSLCEILLKINKVSKVYPNKIFFVFVFAR